MTTLSASAASDLRADTTMSGELATDADTVAISERAKRQIGLQASDSKARFTGKLPSFFEGFSDG